MPVGSAVVSKSVDPASVKVGDIVTYAQTTDPAGKTSPFVTHRVAKVIQGTGGLSFVTKGDANNTADQNPIPASRLVGRVVLIMPFAGHLTRFVHSPLGLILMIFLPGAILIAGEGLGMAKRRKKVLQSGGTAALAIILCLGCAGQVALASSNPGNATEAYFATATQPLTMTITTGTWGETPDQTRLALLPGDSKAVRPANVPPGPASFPIASVDGADALSLDFGEVDPGNSNDSPDVFRIKNLGTADVQVDILPAEEFAAFVGRIGLGNDPLPTVLAPGEERSVEIKLGIPKDTAPGDYTWIVRVSAGSCSVDVPALLTVPAKGDKNDTEDPGKTDLALLPGDSKAVRPANVPPGPASFPIASVDGADALSLDFGEVDPGNGNNSPDVFRIKNLGTAEVQVDILPAGEFAAFVRRIGLGNDPLPGALAPGEGRSVEIKLDIPKDTAPGDYTGIIRVSATDGSLPVDVPALLTVTAKGDKKDDTVTPSDSSGGNAASEEQPPTDEQSPPPESSDQNPTTPQTDTGTVEQTPTTDGTTGETTPADTTTSETVGAPITDLTLEQGSAKAARHDRSPADAPIASFDSGDRLKLDFGEVTGETVRTRDDVFRIYNPSNDTVKVRISVDGRLRAFVDSISLGNGGATEELQAGERQSVTIELKVPERAEPGDYRGVITVAAANGTETIKIPVVITVSERGDETTTDAGSSATTETTGAGQQDPGSPQTDSGTVEQTPTGGGTSDGTATTVTNAETGPTTTAPASATDAPATSSTGTAGTSAPVAGATGAPAAPASGGP